MKVLLARRLKKSEPSKPQNYLNNQLETKTIVNYKVALTEAEVIIGEARELLGIKSE